MFLLIFVSHSLYARSVLRPRDPDLPEISVKLQGESKTFTLRDSHLEEYPTFAFKEKLFYKYQLPKRGIKDIKNNKNKYDTEQIKTLIEDLIVLIQAGKSSFQHFTILQDKNFNWKKNCGLLVLQFNKYPFVLKLFMETPETFANPFCKGLEPIFFFYMAGGSNRHLSGLTRIPNLRLVNKKLTKLPKWKDNVETPRKWFWMPQNQKWLEITGKNIAGKKHLKTKIPSIYAVIADTIDLTDDVDLPISTKKNIVMDLCNDLDLHIDPHYTNFTFHKTDKSWKISIVDTENFRTITGFKDQVTFSDYGTWYMDMIWKCFGDMYCRSKKTWKDAQAKKNPLLTELLNY